MRNNRPEISVRRLCGGVDSVVTGRSAAVFFDISHVSGDMSVGPQGPVAGTCLLRRVLKSVRVVDELIQGKLNGS